MEEQKNKTIGMKPIAGGKQVNDTEGQKKLSYEELNNIAGQLAKENQYLKQQLQGATDSLRMCNRLDYLLRIVEIHNNCKQGNVTFANDFIEECIGEIQDVMKIPEGDSNGKDSKDA